MRERHKRDIVLKTDPVTKEKYWSNEVVTVYKPDEEDRVNAVLDILKGVTTAEEVRKKFDIATVNSVYKRLFSSISAGRTINCQEKNAALYLFFSIIIRILQLVVIHTAPMEI